MIGPEHKLIERIANALEILAQTQVDLLQLQQDFLSKVETSNRLTVSSLANSDRSVAAAEKMAAIYEMLACTELDKRAG